MACSNFPDLPRLVDSVFVFGDYIEGSFEPVGMCFAISGKLLLTAQYNIKPGNCAVNYAFAPAVERNKTLLVDGTVKITNEPSPTNSMRLAKALCFNAAMDYAILEDLSERNDLIPIPISVRPVLPYSSLNVLHGPVGLYNDGDSEAIDSFSARVQTSRPRCHHITFQGDIFAGSSGAPVVTRDGFAVAMYIEGVSRSTNLSENALDEAIEIFSASSNSCPNSHASMRTGLLFSKCPQFIAALTDLNIYFRR